MTKYLQGKQKRKPDNCYTRRVRTVRHFGLNLLTTLFQLHGADIIFLGFAVDQFDVVQIVLENRLSQLPRLVPRMNNFSPFGSTMFFPLTVRKPFTWAKATTILAYYHTRG